jgi:cold shock CspA family protein/ribosome-associated translation inhibitor RaiA
MTWINHGAVVSGQSRRRAISRNLPPVDRDQGRRPCLRCLLFQSKQEAEMAMDLHISFRGMEPSPAAEAQVRRRVEELEQFSDRISACRVVLEAADRHHQHGRIYHVRVDLTVPGGRIVANREPGLNHAHEDLGVAIRDAFDAGRRRLQDHMRRLDGKIKQHDSPLIGRIASVFAERDYGFLETDTGEEVWFHRNSVSGGDFDNLKVGERVRYVTDPEEGEKGAQASAVFPLETAR